MQQSWKLKGGGGYERTCLQVPPRATGADMERCRARSPMQELGPLPPRTRPPDAVGGGRRVSERHMLHVTRQTSCITQATLLTSPHNPVPGALVHIHVHGSSRRRRHAACLHTAIQCRFSDVMLKSLACPSLPPRVSSSQPT